MQDREKPLLDKLKLELKLFKESVGINELDKESLNKLDEKQLLSLFDKILVITDPGECYHLVSAIGKRGSWARTFDVDQWIPIGLALERAIEHKGDPDYIIVDCMHEAFWRHCTLPITSP